MEGMARIPLKCRGEKVPVFRKSVGMLLEETLVTKSLYHKVRSKEM